MTVALGQYLVRPPRYGIGAAATAQRADLPTYIRITDIDEFGRFRPDPMVSVDSPMSGNYLLQDGDIVIARTGASVGKSYRYRTSDGELVFAGFLVAIRPDSRRLDPRYLAYVLQSKPYWDWVSSESTRSGQPGINAQQIARLGIDGVAIDEQRAIAVVLEDADGLIDALECLIEKRRDIQQGIVQELMTGRTRLPGYSGDWHEVRLREAGGTYGGLTGKDKNDFGVGSGLFVTFVEVMAGARLLGLRLERVRVRPGEHQNQVQRGDVLFNGSSETPEEVALAAVIDFDPKPGTFLNSFCFGYRLNDGQRIVPAYLAYFFRSTQGRMAVSELAQGATRYNIAKTKLIELAPLLPSIREQRAIVGVLRDAEKAIEALERRLKSARDVKTGVMQELLTGRTRLPVGAAL